MTGKRNKTAACYKIPKTIERWWRHKRPEGKRTLHKLERRSIRKELRSI